MLKDCTKPVKSAAYTSMVTRQTGKRLATLKKYQKKSRKIRFQQLHRPNTWLCYYNGRILEVGKIRRKEKD